MERIAVAIATRDRPAGCQRVVDAVLRQRMPSHARLRVVVTDNAAVASSPQLPGSVELLNEPRPGIPHARNRAVGHVVDEVDVIVFIDDDEEPTDTEWLSRLIDGFASYGADLVTGPVRRVHDPTAPRWAAAHPVFKRRRLATGTRCQEAFTGNLAVRSSVFRQADRWFDPTLATTGGSDTEFTRRMARLGATIVWVDEAEVIEHVPVSRATLRWILRRSLRLGANRIERLRARPRSPATYAIHLAGAAAEIVGGLTLAALTPVLGRRRGAIGLGRVARGLGVYYALVRGRGVQEYRRLT